MSTIIWIAVSITGLIALLVAGMVIMARQHAQQVHKRMTGDLNEVVARQNMTVDEVDFLIRRVIAIDHSRQLLLYIDCNGEEDKVDIFDCAQIRNCTIARSGNGVTESRNGLQIADEVRGQIGLSLLLKNGRECFLQFYNEIKDGIDERRHLDEKAIKWQRILMPGPGQIHPFQNS